MIVVRSAEIGAGLPARQSSVKKKAQRSFGQGLYPITLSFCDVLIPILQTAPLFSAWRAAAQ